MSWDPIKKTVSEGPHPPSGPSDTVSTLPVRRNSSRKGAAGTVTTRRFVGAVPAKPSPEASAFVVNMSAWLVTDCVEILQELRRDKDLNQETKLCLGRAIFYLASARRALEP